MGPRPVHFPVPARPSSASTGKEPHTPRASHPPLPARGPVSGQATGWVLRNGPRDRAQRMVLLTIADAANRDGEHARPGLQAMVEGSLYSEGHVRRTLAVLIDEGWIVQTEQPANGRVPEYAVPGVLAEGYGARGARRPSAPPAPDTARTARVHRANGARPDARCEDAQSSFPVNGNGDGPCVAEAPPVVAAGRATDDPIKDHAHRLAVLAHEQTPRPVTRGGFPAVMARIEAELRAGTTVQALRDAICAGEVTWTADGLRTAISRARPRSRDPLRRGGPALADQVAHLAALEHAAVEAS